MSKPARSRQKLGCENPLGFRANVYDVVRSVPPGTVTTYGDVAGAMGNPRLARQVGFALAALEDKWGEVPWHRVINSQGRISFRGDDERAIEQKKRLELEGICFGPGGKVVEFQKLRYKYSLRLGETLDD